MILITISHFIVCQCKRPEQSHAKIVAAPIILFTVVGAVSDILLTHWFAFEDLLLWDSIAYVIFTVPIVCLQIFLFRNKEKHMFNYVAKICELHMLNLPMPVWLLMKPPPPYSAIWE